MTQIFTVSTLCHSHPVHFPNNTDIEKASIILNPPNDSECAGESTIIMLGAMYIHACWLLCNREIKCHLEPST